MTENDALGSGSRWEPPSVAWDAPAAEWPTRALPDGEGWASGDGTDDSGGDA